MNLIMERLRGALTTLQLGECDALLDMHLEAAAQQERTYAEFLCLLLEAEVEARRTRALAARMRMAGLPTPKTLGQFDFAFQPSVDERQVGSNPTFVLWGAIWPQAARRSSITNRSCKSRSNRP